MATEFKENLLPNAESIESLQEKQDAVLLKPVVSWGVLVQINEMPLGEDDEAWVEKVDMLLQHGIDVVVSNEELELAEVEGYYLVHTPEKFEVEDLRNFISENNIEVLDGSSR